MSRFLVAACLCLLIYACVLYIKPAQLGGTCPAFMGAVKEEVRKCLPVYWKGSEAQASWT